MVPCQSTNDKVATFRAAWLRVASAAAASIVAWNEPELEASLEVLARLFHAVERESIAEPLLAGLEQDLDALTSPDLRANLVAIHDRSASTRTVKTHFLDNFVMKTRRGFGLGVCIDSF